MQLRYMGSKSWLAPHMERLLGDVAVLHSPFFGSGKLEYYLAARRPALEVRGVDAFEPVANLQRCYLRRDPVFLRSLLRLVGRKVDRPFYFSRLLPGFQRGRAGRRAASYVLPRNSFSGKWGSFTQQRPLALSSVRRLQRPPTNVIVRCRAYLRALPRLAPRHCIYADPPYIFPGRAMNYYGTRGPGHDLAFQTVTLLRIPLSARKTCKFQPAEFVTASSPLSFGPKSAQKRPSSREAFFVGKFESIMEQGDSSMAHE